MITCVACFIVFFDEKDWEWHERRKQHELDTDSANRSKHYGGGCHFERSDQTD